MTLPLRPAVAWRDCFPAGAYPGTLIIRCLSILLVALRENLLSAGFPRQDLQVWKHGTGHTWLSWAPLTFRWSLLCLLSLLWPHLWSSGDLWHLSLAWSALTCPSLNFPSWCPVSWVLCYTVMLKRVPEASHPWLLSLARRCFLLSIFWGWLELSGCYYSFQPFL